MLTERREYIAAEMLLVIEENWGTKSPKPWGSELKMEICNFLTIHRA